MCNNMIELNFHTSHHFTFQQNNYHEISRFDTIEFAVLMDEDVVATFLVIAHEVEWSLVTALNYTPLFHSPFFTVAIYPKCPEHLELTVIMGFCNYFLDRYPEYKAIYTKFYTPEMKQGLLTLGFKYLARDIVYFQKEEGSD